MDRGADFIYDTTVALSDVENSNEIMMEEGKLLAIENESSRLNIIEVLLGSLGVF
eukprot:CAMPEP_0174914538 /NCGR_PEP_ID=MMETSP0167-20121228/80895_1 /TAXON_ID=38298 /ORGANISM="Rhodella maculata, Strain CCMP736" /LENGTH=54 /DNA_ID=CAMNT_0016159305 /DNA_START=120 /DNA_END=284 /DNA_ORIENTATION=+